MWYKNKKLITEKGWEREIGKLKEEIKAKTTINDKAVIKKLLQGMIFSAIKNSMPKERFGILFSGGVDSALIAFVCKKLKGNFVCYSVGLDKSEDLIYAKMAAKDLKLSLKYKQLTINESEKIIRKTVKILGKKLNNIVNIGVGSVEVACMELAKRDKIKYFYSGLGSEEIFAGYQRHELAKDINKECWNGLKNMRQRDLLRDYAIAKEYKISFITPFLDRELIKLAMQIPAGLKIKNEVKKYILREFALDLGIKKDFSFRKKKAAQYGSNFDKAIEKLAKKNNFKYKKDYLLSLV